MRNGNYLFEETPETHSFGGCSFAEEFVHKGLGNAGMVAFSTVVGGGAAALTGGNFWVGAATGLLVSVCNHLAHPMSDDSDPPKKGEAEQEYWRKYNEERLLPLNKALIDFALIADGAAGLSELFSFKISTLTSLFVSGLNLESSISNAMGNSYQSVSSVSVPIKNMELLSSLKSTSKGNWVKIYEAGMKNGNKIETHYFKNMNTRQVFDVKIKYNYWHQKAFKNLQ